jgi:hypothetical protein
MGSRPALGAYARAVLVRAAAVHRAGRPAAGPRWTLAEVLEEGDRATGVSKTGVCGMPPGPASQPQRITGTDDGAAVLKADGLFA